MHDHGASTLVWHLDGQSGAIEFPREAIDVVTRDVNGDGTPELVVFSRPIRPYPIDEDAIRAWIIGVAPGRMPARMVRLELAVLGAFDSSSLDRELANVSEFGAIYSPTMFSARHATPFERLVVRLNRAHADDIRQLVGPSGLLFCDRWTHKRTCSLIERDEIDEAVAHKIATHGGSFAEYATSPKERSPADLTPPVCTSHSENAPLITCSANEGDARGATWTFVRSKEKIGERIQLVEIERWSEDT